MKGITEIISIIMILMIVIALAAVAYTWFSGMFSDMLKTASTSLTSSSRAMATQFKIESATYKSSNIYVTMRNIGTQNFNASRSLFYVRDTPGMFSDITCPSCNCNNLEPGCIASYTIPGAPFGTISAGDTVRMTIDTGLQDSKAILVLP